MASDDHSGARPAGPVVLRIKLRYDDLDTLVQRFASNVGKSGLFLPTRSIQPVGTEVKFELRLANDTPVLVGLGRVKHVKPPDPAQPKAAFGMAIELMRVSREGREVIIKMIERRRALGLPDVAIPIPDDIEAARRNEVETQPRADTSGIVREAMKDFASAPVAEQILSAPRPSEPVATPSEAALAAKPSEPVATPEPAAKPSEPALPVKMPVIEPSKPIPVPVLAPEPSKPKRPRVSDLLAKANELAERLATVDMSGVEVQVDLDRALARARALAGSDVDGELAALRESAAAPLAEITVEAASAELARQLGGKPIARRERSAKWSAPAPVAVRADSSAVAIVPPAPPDTDGFIVKTRAETEASPASVIAAVTTAIVEPTPEPAPEPAPEPVPEPAVAEDDEPAAEYARDDKTRIPVGDDQDSAFLPNASTTTLSDAEDALEVPLEAPIEAPRAYESSPALQLDESDLEAIEDERGESTHIGGFPIDPNMFGNAEPAFPQPPEDLSDRLDRQLAEAEEEVDADFRAASAAEASAAEPYAIGPYADEYAHDPAGYPEEIADGDVLAEADASDADLMAAHGERDVGEQPPPYSDEQQAAYDAQIAGYEQQAGYEQPAYAEPAPGYAEPAYAEPAYAEPAYAEPEPAYAEPAPAYAEPEPAYPEPVFPDEVPGYEEPALRPSQEDFAARLDLGDDEELDEEERRNFPTANPRPRTRPPSVNEPAFLNHPSESYTFAEPLRTSNNLSFPPHQTGEDFDEPHGFSQNTPAPASRTPGYAPDFEQPVAAREHDDPVARTLEALDEPSQPKARVPTPEPSEDLEDALAALDVDLDPLVQEQRRARRKSAQHRPLPGLPLHRPGETGQTQLPEARPQRTTGANVIARPARTTGANVIQRATPTGKSTTVPPPIPAAARRPATVPPPVPVRPPPKRATTDDGILIDFDDDE